MYNQDESCKHETLKWFDKTQSVVCMDCGQSWNNNFVYDPPMIPCPSPTPMPDYPIYPTITWNKVSEEIFN